MASSSSKTDLVIVFLTSANKSVTMTIAEPKDTITKAQVDTYTQFIIDNQLFSSSGAFLTKVKEYYIRASDTVITDVEV